MGTREMEFRFTYKITPYDANYIASERTRATTNFANFARDPGQHRQRILVFLDLVNTDLNTLLGASDSQRYAIELEILSLSIHFDQATSDEGVLLTETMRARVDDRHGDQIIPGPTGLNFSSYLRDYDFRIVLPQLLNIKASPQEWKRFGNLHGRLTQLQFGTEGLIPDPLTIAISIAQQHPYQATPYKHPILGREYTTESSSLTDQYFAQMGLQARFFKPDHLPAPLAIFSSHSYLQESDVYLASLVAVMGNFQRIYRPEIYLSHSHFSAIPGEVSQASLQNLDYSQPMLTYDRNEREHLADHQAHLIEDTLVKPYGTGLSQALHLEDP
jgi:hypothetical protein